MTPTAILFLVGRRDDVSVCFRVEQVRPHLAARGIGSEVERMGAAGRRTVENTDSTAANLERWLAVLGTSKRTPS